MPLQPNISQIRFNNIVTALTVALATFKAVTESLKTPFLEPILNALQSLLTVVQTIKRNKDTCTQVLKQIHELIYAIIHLHVHSDTGGQLSPYMLKTLGRFMETLPKIHTFVEAQQQKSRVRKFFRQGEMNSLLKGCQVGLEQALEVFKITSVQVLSDAMDMQEYAEKTHQQVLELIACMSDGTSSDGTSTLSKVLFSSQHSSNSLSLLPSEPKIFHGRQSEVSAIIQSLRQETPRIAILGAGGMGKTSLARAVLHHPEIIAQYDQHRVFVACDTTSTSIQLAGLIGSYLGLKPSKDLTRPVVNYFSQSPPYILILDNLETIWDPTESRGEVEGFLALLSDVDHLALIITMRGAERPANVRWTRPFLGPLEPLSQDAARETFIDIADDAYTLEDIDKILLLADNMPLAVDLIAHAVDHEGVSSVLDRWETERTLLLSEGYDRTSNLDLSISLSLQSARLTSLPQAKDLLSLLSILPDGLSDVDLRQSNLPIDNILASKAALLKTSLAYIDIQGRLKTLVPIREYVYKMHPPLAKMVQAINKHFQQLLEVYVGSVPDTGTVARITANSANIENILSKGLSSENSDIIQTIYCICYFDRFSRQIRHRRLQLMDQVSGALLRPRDYRLEVFLIMQQFAGFGHHAIPNADRLVDEALDHFSRFDDPDMKCQVYDLLPDYYIFSGNDIPKALQLTQSGIVLSSSTGNTQRQSNLLTTLATIKCRTGDYVEAHTHAHEAQRLARISGHLYTEARALQTKSVCWIALGNYKYGISLANEARALLSLCAMSGGVLDHMVMGAVAEAHYTRSEYIEACDIYRGLLQDMSDGQTPYINAMVLVKLSQIYVEIGASANNVQTSIDTAHSIFNKVGSVVGMTFCDTVHAALDLRQGDLSAARGSFEIGSKSSAQPATPTHIALIVQQANQLEMRVEERADVDRRLEKVQAC